MYHWIQAAHPIFLGHFPYTVCVSHLCPAGYERWPRGLSPHRTKVALPIKPTVNLVMFTNFTNYSYQPPKNVYNPIPPKKKQRESQRLKDVYAPYFSAWFLALNGARYHELDLRAPLLRLCGGPDAVAFCRLGRGEHRGLRPLAAGVAFFVAADGKLEGTT